MGQEPTRRYLAGPVVRLAATDSTHRVAAERAAGGAPEGLVVRADRQEAGRGRQGRAWHSPEGGLWLSVVLRPPRLEGLTLAAGLAVARTARRFGVPATVRWPNDVYAGERKLAGILADGRYAGSRVEHAVLGIGLDVNLADFPEELRGLATSLSLETGGPLDLEEVFEALLDEVEAAYGTWREAGLDGVRGELEGLCSTLGRNVRIHTEGGVTEGRAAGLGQDGCLVLEDGREFRSVERVEVL